MPRQKSRANLSQNWGRVNKSLRSVSYWSTVMLLEASPLPMSLLSLMYCPHIAINTLLKSLCYQHLEKPSSEMFIICIYAALHLCGVLALLWGYTAAASPRCAPPVTLPSVEIPTNPPAPALPPCGRHTRTCFSSLGSRGMDASAVARAPGGKRDRATGVRCRTQVVPRTSSSHRTSLGA